MKKKNFRVDDKKVDDEVVDDEENDIDRINDDEVVDDEEDKITGEHKVDNNGDEENFAPFKEGVIEFTEHAEVPVVSKEPRVVEEISINKKVEEHREHVKDSVIRNEVDVEKLKRDELED